MQYALWFMGGGMGGLCGMDNSLLDIQANVTVDYVPGNVPLNTVQTQYSPNSIQSTPIARPTNCKFHASFFVCGIGASSLVSHWCTASAHEATYLGQETGPTPYLAHLAIGFSPEPDFGVAIEIEPAIVYPQPVFIVPKRLVSSILMAVLYMAVLFENFISNFSPRSPIYSPLVLSDSDATDASLAVNPGSGLEALNDSILAEFQPVESAPWTPRSPSPDESGVRKRKLDSCPGRPKKLKSAPLPERVLPRTSRRAMPGPSSTPKPRRVSPTRASRRQAPPGSPRVPVNTSRRGRISPVPASSTPTVTIHLPSDPASDMPSFSGPGAIKVKFHHVHEFTINSEQKDGEQTTIVFPNKSTAWVTVG